MWISQRIWPPSRHEPLNVWLHWFLCVHNSKFMMEIKIMVYLHTNISFKQHKMNTLTWKTIFQPIMLLLQIINKFITWIILYITWLWKKSIEIFVLFFVEGSLTKTKTLSLNPFLNSIILLLAWCSIGRVSTHRISLSLPLNS